LCKIRNKNDATTPNGNNTIKNIYIIIIIIIIIMGCFFFIKKLSWKFSLKEKQRIAIRSTEKYSFPRTQMECNIKYFKRNETTVVGIYCFATNHIIIIIAKLQLKLLNVKIARV